MTLFYEILKKVLKICGPDDMHLAGSKSYFHFFCCLFWFSHQIRFAASTSLHFVFFEGEGRRRKIIYKSSAYNDRLSLELLYFNDHITK